MSKNAAMGTIEKLAILNSIPVTDHGDADCPYVYVKDTPEVREKLRLIGFDPDSKKLYVEDGEIDLIVPAMFAGATGWWKGKFRVTRRDLAVQELKAALAQENQNEIVQCARRVVEAVESEDSPYWSGWAEADEVLKGA